MKTKHVLTIAGSDSGGGAGIQADLKTITVLGGFGMSVITALTAQNTQGVQGVFDVPPEFIEKQFDSVCSDISVHAAKTGMLSNSGIIKLVAAKIREYDIKKLVVDPVMVAKGGAPLLQEEAQKTIIEILIPLALVVTPNIPEAEVLSGKSISGKEDMMEAAKIIHGMGAANVVVKGGHLEGEVIDLIYDGRDFYDFVSERIRTKNTHGTGCTFSAAIATYLAQDMPVVDAVRSAKEYITIAIKYALEIGSGHGPTNHFALVQRRLEDAGVL